MNSDNLVIFGIHPRWHHAGLNTPLMFGPLLVLAVASVFLKSDIVFNGFKKVNTWSVRHRPPSIAKLRACTLHR